MAWVPPVNIPDIGGQDYSRQLYGMISGVGDAIYQGRRDRVEDANADRNYGLALQKLAQGNEATYGVNPFLIDTPEGVKAALINNAGGYKILDFGEGASPANTVFRDLGNYIGAYDRSGKLISLTPKSGAPEPGTVPDPNNPPLLPATIPVDRNGVPQGTMPAAGFDQNPMFGADAPAGQPTAPPARPPAVISDGRTSTGGVVPITGSGAERDARKENREFIQVDTKAAARLAGAAEESQKINRYVSEARKLIDSGWATGTTGLAMESVGALFPTSRNELQNYIQTLKGITSFGNLAQMRQESPTGAAVGNVANYEVQLLGALEGPMDPMQPEQMKKTLDQIVSANERATAAHEIAYMVDNMGLPIDVARDAFDALAGSGEYDKPQNPRGIVNALKSMMAGGQ